MLPPPVVKTDPVPTKIFNPASRLILPAAVKIVPLAVLPLPPLRRILPVPGVIVLFAKLYPAFSATDQSFASVILELLEKGMLPPASSVSCPAVWPGAGAQIPDGAGVEADIARWLAE